MSLTVSDSPLQARVTTIAQDLRAITGARRVALRLEEDGEELFAHAAAAGQAAASAVAADEEVLRRAASGQVEAEVGGLPALAMPLGVGGRQLGTALLVFARPAPSAEQIGAAIQLSARAVDALRQYDTLQVRAEQLLEGMRLREIQISRNLIRGVIDSVPIGLALIEEGGEIRAINRALAERFGSEPAALVGMSYDSVMGSWDSSPAARTLATGMPQRARTSLQVPGRSQVLIEIASFPIADGGDQPQQVVEVWEDVTERVTLQTQLVRAEKLAAIGQLAASIAHEVGNPLQAIQGFLALFLEQCSPDTPNQHFLQLAEEEIDRIVQVLARLRDLYRPQADVVAPTSLNELAEAVLLLTSRQLQRAKVRVRKELTPDLPRIDMVSDQIKQVLLNLVLNAAEAMPDGGILHMQTYQQVERSGARTVTLTVTDTGVGIPADQLPYLFDGLHTTKERGMGLGLYTSRAIIERHMGRITVQSTIGEGTTFTISLPVREAEITPAV